MPIGKMKSEKEFLMGLALAQFNSQYHRKLVPEECLIISIAPSYGCKYGYEISTIRSDDYARLRIYINLEGMDNLKSYRLETDKTFKKGALGDEVYVAIGTVNEYYVDEGLYSFRWIASTGPVVENINLMMGETFNFMNGDPLQLVGGGTL